MQHHEHRFLDRIGRLVVVLSLGGCFEVEGLEPTDEGVADEDFDELDDNSDGALDFEEFRVGFADQGTFSRFDANADGFVSAIEFENALFRELDADRDNLITRTDYDRGMASFTRTAVTPSFSELDTNVDGNLTTAEFSSADDPIFAAFDTDQDGLLRLDEFDQGFFDAFDSNLDGTLSPTEFNAATL